MFRSSVHGYGRGKLIDQRKRIALILVPLKERPSELQGTSTARNRICSLQRNLFSMMKQ